MLYTLAENMQPVDGVVEGSYDDPTLWPQDPFGGEKSRALTIFLGDTESGPSLNLVNSSPGATALPPIPHSHRSDTFRIAIGDQADQITAVDGDLWMSGGDFVVNAANEVEIEKTSPDGYQLLFVFADRGGSFFDFRGTEEDLDPQYAAMLTLGPDEQYAQFQAIASNIFGPDHNVHIHRTPDTAVRGGNATFTEPPGEKEQLFGSMNDVDAWAELSDGSRVGAMFVADATSGPMVLVSHNAPGAVEAPGGAYGSDCYRLVLRGSVAVGDRTYGMGEFRTVEAGVEEGAVVHGPEGSRQLLFFADRRGWLPNGAAALEDCARLGEIAALVAPYVDATGLATSR